MAKKYGLIVVSSEYADPIFPNLKKANADGYGVKNILVSTEFFGFQAENVKLLVNEDDRTVRTAVRRFFQSKEPDDLLFFYFAGHGRRDDKGKLCLVLKTTEDDVLSETSISCESLRDSMDSSRAREQILILDSCYSGAFDSRDVNALHTEDVKETFELSDKLDRVRNTIARFVISVTGRSSLAYESYPGLEESEHGIFVKTLLEGLQQEECKDREGNISIQSIFNYVSPKVAALTEYKQIPHHWTYGNNNDILLVKKTKVRIPHEVQERLKSENPDIRFAALGQVSQLNIRGEISNSEATLIFEKFDFDRDILVQNFARDRINALRIDKEKALKASEVREPQRTERDNAAEGDTMSSATQDETIQTTNKIMILYGVVFSFIIFITIIVSQ